MSVPLKTLCPQTSKDTPSVTSLQVLQDGLMPSNLPDGRRKNLYGLDHVPVSRFRAREEDREQMTPGIFGQLSSGSSPSANLQRSLGSKLEEILEGSGSPLYDLTWSKKIMPSGLPICQQRALGHHTNGKGFFGWPTPGASKISNMSMFHKTALKVFQGTSDHHVIGQAWMITGEILRSWGVLMDQKCALNPEHQRWLMGYPKTWTSCAPTEMP